MNTFTSNILKPKHCEVDLSSHTIAQGSVLNTSVVPLTIEKPAVTSFKLVYCPLAHIYILQLHIFS